MGRKNYLFAGSDAGGERAAAAYTLIETAKLNGLDPEAYLRAVIGRIADHPINRIAELLPWNIGLTPPLRAVACRVHIKPKRTQPSRDAYPRRASSGGA